MASNEYLAEIFVPFPPETKQASGHPNLQLPLRWWNTHYKHNHQFVGGRIETLYRNEHKNYHLLGEEKRQEPLVNVVCPYCQKKCVFTVASIDKIKGDIHCPFCRKQYGIHPNGQMFVVKEIVQSKKASFSNRKEFVSWINQEAYQNDWELETGKTGITIVLSSKVGKPKVTNRTDGTIDDGVARSRETAWRSLSDMVEELKSTLAAKGLDYI